MNYIQFESAREKEKARQELREAREQMLIEAKKRFEQRADREVKKCLKNETNWMLPSVEEKLFAEGKEKKKAKKSKTKRSKKRSGKKRKYSSSDTDSDSSDSDSSSEETSSSSSSEEERKRRKKSKKIKKKSKISKKNKSLSSNKEECDNKEESNRNVNEPKEPLKRDSWMTSPLMLKTYAKEKVEKKSNENQQVDSYDPVKSIRELNPYWKTTGTGLPSFIKPNEGVDDDGYVQSNKFKTSFSSRIHSSKSWKKQNDEKKLANESPLPQRNKSPINKHTFSSEDDSEENYKKCSTASASQFLNDEQMNELGAKVLKAELMGNMLLASKLREQLENARTQRNIFKENQKQAYIEENSKQNHSKGNKKEEHVLLTRTDKAGCTRPLPASKVLDPRDLYGGKSKQKQKPVQTHNKFGERVRYFADDDRYSIKEMFEKEKYKSSADINLEFANIANKHKNPNNDMEDIFAEKICKDNSFHSSEKERNRAIREHQKMEATLDNCTKCLDSTKMQKELLVSVGEKVYLALPWYQGLQEGHCMIIPNQHTTCCTQIDEDTWTEINDFRKALTRMFLAQRKDVIFFEIANRLHKRPHLVIHCIPIRETDGEMAPFYFKKAIEESEHEWCTNKQLVSLRNKSLRSCIPKGLPYFWVNFGMDTGFAHVIEDEERFPANFAQEIIGGMLNLDAKKWRKLQKEHDIITKVKLFADIWKKYDCTK